MSKQIDKDLLGLSMSVHDAAVQLVECDKALEAAGALAPEHVRTYWEAREHAVAMIGAAVSSALGAQL